MSKLCDLWYAHSLTDHCPLWYTDQAQVAYSNKSLLSPYGHSLYDQLLFALQKGENYVIQI